LANRSKRTKKAEARILDALRSGMAKGTAAAQAGIGRRTLYEWCDDDPEFAAQVEEATEYGTDVLEDVGWSRAIRHSDVLLTFFLKARRPEKYRERNETIFKGDPDAPIVINFIRDDKASG